MFLMKAWQGMISPVYLTCMLYYYYCMRPATFTSVRDTYLNDVIHRGDRRKNIH